MCGARAVRFIVPVAVVSGLFGAATAMVLAGLVLELRSVFGALSSHYVLAGGFLALALGIRVPQRVTMWACANLWQRVVRRDRPSSVPGILVTRGPADRPLYWIVLSIIALAAGLATAVVPFGFRIVLAGYDWLLAHFVWSDLPLIVLQMTCAFLLGAAPLAMLGLALSCAHHMSCPHGRWDVRATGWHFLGAGLGIWLVALGKASGVATDALLVGASLPPLVVAVFCAGLVSKRREQVNRQTPEPPELPERSDRRPAFLRAGIVVVGGSAAVTVGLAHRIASAHTAMTLVALAVAATGAGVLLGVRIRPRGSRTMNGFGVCAVACGLAVAVGSPAILRPSWIGDCSTTTLLCVMLGVFGFTMGYGREMLMARVASRSSEGSKMTARLLLCVAVSVGVAAPLVTAALGEARTFVLLAVSLLALGARLMGGDRESAYRVRRLRVGAVAASIVLMVILAMTRGSPWRSSPVPVAVLAEGQERRSSDALAPIGDHRPTDASALPINTH